MTRFVQQTSWARGEIEPTLEGRQDSDFYQFSAELLENWMPDTVSSIGVRAPFESIHRIPRTIVVDEAGVETELVLREDQQNLLAYVYRGVQAVIHLALYAGADGLDRLTVRTHKVTINRIDTDSPVKVSSQVETGQRFVSEPFSNTEGRVPFEVGFAVAGPAAFISHQRLPVLRVFPSNQDPAQAQFNVSTIDWFQELFGFATPTSGGTSWLGDEDALFDEQLEVGDTVKFRNVLYTVASTFITEEPVEDDDPPEGIHGFTTTETYDGPAIADRVDKSVDDPFDGRPALVAFYQGRLVLASTNDKPTGVWLSRSNDPFTIVPSSVDENSPINQELFAEGADEFVWMTGGDRLYLGSGLGEYALGTPDETLTPLQLRFFRIGNNGGAKITPVIADGAVIFANRSRSQVLQVIYDLGRQSFATTNLSLLASHLTRGLNDLTYRPPVENDRTPRIFALADGNLRAFALSEAASLAAWSRVTYSPAFHVVSIAATSEYLFAVCNRRSNAVDLAVLRNE